MTEETKQELIEYWEKQISEDCTKMLEQAEKYPKWFRMKQTLYHSKIKRVAMPIVVLIEKICGHGLTPSPSPKERGGEKKK